jgi:hypothetical protein
LSNFDLFGDVCNKSWLRYVLVFFFFFNTKFHLFGICVSRLGLYIELVYLEEKGNGKKKKKKETVTVFAEKKPKR